MFLEILAFLVCAAVAWYFQFRPRSLFNVRPPYVLLHKAPEPTPSSTSPFVAFDYIVVGGGPGGLAAARALLEKTQQSGASILLVERGHESLPESTWESYAQSASRSRLLAFSPDMVYLPVNSGMLPGKLGPTLLGDCVDMGGVSHRPFRFPSDEDHVESEHGEQTFQAHPSTEGKSSTVTGSGHHQRSIKARITEALFSYTTYPQGTGMGGTAQLEWGLHFPTAFSTKETHVEEVVATETAAHDRQHWWELPCGFAKTRNPLSWAFAESAAAHMVAERYLPSEQRPCKRNTVYPAFVRVDADGRRLPLASAVLAGVPEGQLRRLSVLVDHTVLSLNPGDSDAEDRDGVPREVVESITCVSTQGKARCTIEVNKGVVVCAGVVQTPRLLRSLAPSPLLRASTRVRDVMALPMIFRAQARVSMDAKNMQDTKGTALWFLTQRGPYLQPMTDTIASLPLPELGPAAEMRFFFLPFGGRDPRRFYQMGWDRVLGSFEDGITVLMALVGVDGLTHPLELGAREGGTAVGTRSLLKQRHLRPLAVIEDAVVAELEGSDTPTAKGKGDGIDDAVGADREEGIECLPARVEEGVVAAFLKGMRACRTVTSVPPLSHLAPARGGHVDGDCAEEAIDYTLLRENPTQAVQLAKLMHTPSNKRTVRMRRDAVRLLEWAFAEVNTEAYMRRYVRQHAYWLGFGSGSAEPFLSAGKDFFVDGVANAVVGDNSAVTETVWAASGKDSFAAGSLDNAVMAGKLAAEALVGRA